MEVKAIIQARVASLRLPRKVLLKIMDKTVLEYVVERVSQAKNIKDIIVATTIKKEDSEIASLVNKLGMAVYRGSEEDVLDRFYQVAKEFKADVILRITADCPLHDPGLIDKFIDFYLKNADKFDYVDNVMQPTFPDGLDLWIFPFGTLEKAWKEAKLKSEREHVCPYMWKNKDIFRTGCFKSEVNYSDMRWTLDDVTDFEFIKKIYENLYQDGEIFCFADILNFLDRHPDLLRLQKNKIRDEGYLKSVREDKTG